MRRPTLRIEPYNHSATSPFVIEGYRVNGKRQRLFFKTKKEAETKLGQIKTQIANEGTAGLAITTEFRVMAAKCADDLKPFGVTIADATAFYIEGRKHADTLAPFGKTVSDAVSFYLDYLKLAERSCTFTELVESFIAAKTKDGASDRYLNDLRSRYGRATQEFGPCKVATIEAREVDDWLRDLPLSPQSRNNFRTVLHALFGYAVQRGYCVLNPVAKTAKAKLVDKAPEIFTPQEAHALLEAALPDPEPEEGATDDDTPRWLGHPSGANCQRPMDEL